MKVKRQIHRSIILSRVMVYEADWVVGQARRASGLWRGVEMAANGGWPWARAL